MSEKHESFSMGLLYYPITSLGYGRRIGLWFSGCNRNCFGCITPEFKTFGKNTNTKDVIDFIEQKFLDDQCDGITISGGEPFEQPEALDEVVRTAKRFTNDILVFSGYTYEELRKRDCMYTKNVLDSIGVLIDGEYKQALNDGLGLRGSINQNIIILIPELEGRYSGADIWQRRQEILIVNGKVVVAGIH